MGAVGHPGDLPPVEVSLYNKDMRSGTVNHSILSIGKEEGVGNFLRSIPTRESLQCPRGSVVSFHDIQYTIKQSHGPLCKRTTVEKKILYNVCGIMKPGLNAILGPTGSGKSSLLDVLAARKDPAGLSGQVLVDGFPQPPNFKCISGYVVQVSVSAAESGNRQASSAGFKMGDWTSHAESCLGSLTLGVISDEEQNVDRSMVETLHQQYLNSSQYRDTREELKKVELSQQNEQGKSRHVNKVTYANGFFTQLYWVSKRAIKNLIRNPQASVAQIAVTIILALIVGAIFFGVKLDRTGIQNRVGSLFFVTTNQCFSSVSAIELFIKDKKLFVHQYTSGYYRVSAYFFALMIGDLLPMRTVPVIIFSCISYWMIGYQAVAGRFFFFMLTLALVSYAATAMSLAISAGMNVVAIANLFITICFVFMLIFSGLLVNLPSVMGWLNWLKYFSIPRYGLTALQVNEFRDLYFCGENPQNITASPGNAVDCSPNATQFGETCYGETYLCSQGIASTNWAMWENIVALGCMTAIFLLIAYGKLRFMKKFT
uniref:ABC-2 type transporter transmembrane domain-containing protein n=1 Tax=Chelydra serpentina TaxID=8475 RepID=A0A8C3SKQ7_CHESE